jgi:hypothetical protein
MIPRLSLGLLVVALLAYLAGARYPGLAQKIGAA